MNSAPTWVTYICSVETLRSTAGSHHRYTWTVKQTDAHSYALQYTFGIDNWRLGSPTWSLDFHLASTLPDPQARPHVYQPFFPMCTKILCKQLQRVRQAGLKIWTPQWKTVTGLCWFTQGLTGVQNSFASTWKWVTELHIMGRAGQKTLLLFILGRGV